MVYEYLKQTEEYAAFPSGSRPDLDERLSDLKDKIEKALPLEEALNHYQEAKSNYDFYKKELKDLRKEISLCNEIAEATFHSYDLDAVWIQEQYHKKDRNTGELLTE